MFGTVSNSDEKFETLKTSCENRGGNKEKEKEKKKEKNVYSN